MTGAISTIYDVLLVVELVRDSHSPRI